MTQIQGLDKNTGLPSPIYASNGGLSVNTLATAMGVSGRSPKEVTKPHDAISLTQVTAQTNLSLVIVNLNQLSHAGEFALDCTITTNATAPGASRTLTLKWQYLSFTGATAPEVFGTGNHNTFDSRILNLVNAASTTRHFKIKPTELGLQSGQYLYLAIDHTARDSGSTLTITTRLIAV
jgi:hypothetical protein